MNEQRPLARVILTTVDMLRAVREEIIRLEKAGHPGIAGRRETGTARDSSPQLVNALIEVAARLAVQDGD